MWLREGAVDMCVYPGVEVTFFLSIYTHPCCGAWGFCHHRTVCSWKARYAS